MKNRPFTQAEKDFITANYASLTAKELGKAVGRNHVSIRNFAIRNKLRKGPNPVSYFPKGHKPHNKGRKGWNPAGCEKTHFPKGHLPHNTKADGAISIRQKVHADGRKDPAYKYIRIGLGKWEAYHRYLWKQAGREIPNGQILVFVNGDTMDCRLDNLKLITRAENARRNHNPQKASLHSNCIARALTHNEPHLREAVKNNPELIALKRAQIQLNREIKTHESNKAA